MYLKSSIVIIQLLQHLLDYFWYCHSNLSNLKACNCKYETKSNHDYDSIFNVIEYNYLALLTNVIKCEYVFSKKLFKITMSTITEYDPSMSGLDCL